MDEEKVTTHGQYKVRWMFIRPIILLYRFSLVLCQKTFSFTLKNVYNRLIKFFCKLYARMALLLQFQIINKRETLVLLSTVTCA